MLLDETPRPMDTHLAIPRPTSPALLVSLGPTADLEVLSSLHLPEPFVQSKILSKVTVGRRISTAITSLSDPERTYHDAMTHPVGSLTSLGSSTVKGRPIKALSAQQHVALDHDKERNQELDLPAVLSLPRSVSSGTRYASAPNSFHSPLKPLTAIRTGPLAGSVPIIPPHVDDNDEYKAEEGWDKTPKRSFDATPTARPHLIPRAASTLSIRVPSSLQSVSLSTVRPDSLAHHRQLEEYNAVLAALTESHDGRPINGHAVDANDHGPIGHGRGLSIELGPVKVDELAVEWCFFCGRERNRAELELVELGASAGGVGAGEQWVCKDHCEKHDEGNCYDERKIAHGPVYQVLGTDDWVSMRGDQGSSVGRVELVQMSEGSDTEI